MLDLSLGNWRIWYEKVWAAVYLIPSDTKVSEIYFLKKHKNSTWWVPVWQSLNSYQSHTCYLGYKNFHIYVACYCIEFYHALLTHCCRWYSLSWLLQDLLLSHHGQGVSPGQASLINPSLMLLWKCDRELALYLNNVADVGFKLLNLLPLLSYLNMVCNNLIHTLMNELYLWTLYNVWHVCWIMYDLDCMLVELRPFVVLYGLPGFIWAQVW